MDTLFATTAQCAATIIAIIGGFIVTKLISLSTEQKEIEIRLRDIIKEMDYRKQKIADLTTALIEDEALDLITESIELFAKDEIELNEAYDRRRYDFSIDEIRPFWDKAHTLIFEKLTEILETENEFDENGVPKTWAKTLSDFEYSVCKRVMDEIKYQTKLRESNKPQSGFMGFPGIPPMRPLYTTPIFAARDIKAEKSVHESSFSLLSLQENQLNTRKASIETPKNTIMGLLVFIYYACVSVFFPLIILAFLPISSDGVLTALIILDLTLFFSGLVATITYLISFMKKRKDKEGNV